VPQEQQQILDILGQLADDGRKQLTILLLGKSQQPYLCICSCLRKQQLSITRSRAISLRVAFFPCHGCSKLKPEDFEPLILSHSEHEGLKPLNLSQPALCAHGNRISNTYLLQAPSMRVFLLCIYCNRDVSVTCPLCTSPFFHF
jgi:hypothetical protein